MKWLRVVIRERLLVGFSKAGDCRIACQSALLNAACVDAVRLANLAPENFDQVLNRGIVFQHPGNFNCQAKGLWQTFPDLSFEIIQFC